MLSTVIPFLISLLIFVIIASVLFYIARLIISAIPIPQPWANIAYAIVLLIMLSVFLSEIGYAGPPHGWRTWH
jgi:hypothetical protein